MKLYDVHLCTTNSLPITNEKSKIISYITIRYNIPFLIARSIVRMTSSTKNIFLILLPNGTEVMKYFNDRKLKLKK